MITIRPANEEDARLLPAIERSSGEAFRQIGHLAWIADDDVQSTARHLELIRLGSAWVAQSGTHNLIGFLNAERLGESLHIWQMAVLHEWQQKGVGRKLIDAALLWAAQKHLLPVTLTTFCNVAWNESFYHSCGFRRIDTDLPSSLQNILYEEEQAGLPREQRCAMIFTNSKS